MLQIFEIRVFFLTKIMFLFLNTRGVFNVASKMLSTLFFTFFFLSPRFRRKSQDNRLPKAIFSLFYSDEREFRAPMNRFVAGIKSPFPT